MRIMVLGAGGFIGRQIVAELVAHGHAVSAVARRASQIADPEVHVIALDLATATDPAGWAERLEGIDAIINVAGVLRGRDMEAVHVAMPRALYAAAGARRIVLISAISARPDVATDYARSKLAGEAALRALAPHGVILRPSLVYAEGSYGGTSLLRGLAALPIAVPLAGDGGDAFSPIHAADLARTVRLACEDPALAGATLTPAGPETLTLRDLLARYRRWLGFGTARFLRVPLPLMRLFARLGDIAGDGPISTNSLAQLLAGNAGDGAAFESAIGFRPRTLGAALSAHPAQVQDRWHAHLFFLAPAIRLILAALWLASAVLGWLFGTGATVMLVLALGLPPGWVAPLRDGSCLLDLALAGLVLADRDARRATLAQLAVVIGYTLVIGAALPALWLNPLGPLIKNLPILVLILVHGAIGSRR